eukprot:4090450-Amphidinium_carterae.1
MQYPPHSALHGITLVMQGSEERDTQRYKADGFPGETGRHGCEMLTLLLSEDDGELDVDNTIIPEVPIGKQPLQSGNEAKAVQQWSDPEKTLVGLIYTDGAVRHSRVRLARAAGWMMVQLDASGDLARVQYGVVPTAAWPMQSSAEAELWAIRMAARSDWGATEFYSDSKFVVDTTAKDHQKHMNRSSYMRTCGRSTGMLGPC